MTVQQNLSGNDASFNQVDINQINGFSMNGHILPTVNAQYDLGSAEYKIRHLFLSDNSLWIGDQHKIDISGGKLRFRKRDITIPPTKLKMHEALIWKMQKLIEEDNQLKNLH